MTREELRDYVDKQRALNNIPYHVYSALIDGIDTLEPMIVTIAEFEYDEDKLKELVNKSVLTVAPPEPFINKPCVSNGVCEHDKQKVLDKIRAEILEEKECAYADFERYKVEYLGQDWEDALDSLPQDDFRYGMERAIELIDKYKVESENP